jgi:hypothetical protein
MTLPIQSAKALTAFGFRPVANRRQEAAMRHIFCRVTVDTEEECEKLQLLVSGIRKSHLFD